MVGWGCGKIIRDGNSGHTICMARMSWSLKTAANSGMFWLSRSRTRGAYTESHLLAGLSDESFSKLSQAFCDHQLLIRLL